MCDKIFEENQKELGYKLQRFQDGVWVDSDDLAPGMKRGKMLGIATRWVKMKMPDNSKKLFYKLQRCQEGVWNDIEDEEVIAYLVPAIYRVNCLHRQQPSEVLRIVNENDEVVATFSGGNLRVHDPEHNFDDDRVGRFSSIEDIFDQFAGDEDARQS